MKCRIFAAVFNKQVKMRVKAKSRIVIAWLLFMTLMPLFVVKAVHHHGESETAACQSADGEHSHNPCGQCPVCQFTLSPFTQAEAFHAEVIIPVSDYEVVYRVQSISRRLIRSHHLRAPPVLSAL